jgi:predicted amidophosphoribosyltransferase
MKLTEHEACPTCGQALPTTGLVCGNCGKRMGKKHSWHVVNSIVQHHDCDNPLLPPRFIKIAPHETPL